MAWGARMAAVGVLLAASACEKPRPAPALEAVDPAVVSTLVATPASLSGRNFYDDAEVSYDSGSASVDGVWSVLIGSVAAESVVRVDANRLELVVPAGLPIGTFDVVVRAPDGQRGTLEQAITVVSEPLGLPLSIENGPGGTGVPVDATLLAAGETLAAFAVARTTDGVFVSDVDADWSLDGDIGALDATTGTSVLLEAHTVGVGFLSATHPSAVGTMSGAITVEAGPAARVIVQSLPDGAGVEVGALPGSTTDEVLTLYAITRDAFGNFVDNAAATWSILGDDVGAITAVASSAGTLDLDTPGTGFARAALGSLFADSSGGISVSAGEVAVLTVAPNTLTASADDAATSFVVTGADADGNPTSDLGAVTWSVSSGSITAVNAATGAFDPTIAGTGTLRATSSYGPLDDSGAITVTPGIANALTVSPDTAAISADAAPVPFSATATDADGNATTDLGTLTWSISAGAITALNPGTGAFTPTAAGSGNVRVTSTSGLFDDSGTITVTPGQVATLTVTPNSLSVSADANPVLFAAAALDADGNATSNVGTLTWSIASGAITAIGTATGSFDPVTAGTGTVRATSSLGPFDDSSTVTVTAGQAAVLAVAPDTATRSADAPPLAFSVTAVDGDGNATLDLGTVTWSIASGPITAIAPATGSFNPTAAGTGTVRAISSHGPQDVSGAITVTPGIAAAIAVSPDTLSVTADDPATLFSVTATDGDGNATTNVGTVTWNIASGPITAIAAATGSFNPTIAGSGTVRALSSLGPQDVSDAVVVTPGRAVTIAVSPNTLSTTVGAGATSFGVTGTDADGNTTTDLGMLTWSVASGSVATFSGTGVLTPTAVGSGTVRAASSYGPADDSGLVDIAASSGGTPSEMPRACFTVTPTTAPVGATVVFDAGCSNDIEDGIGSMTFRWDFEGDGTWDTGFLAAQTTSHAFAIAGVYNAALEARDTSPNSAYTERRLSIFSATDELVVDISLDENDGNFAPGDLSLREAINLANAAATAKTIRFASAMTIGLTSRLPILTKAGTVVAGQPNVILDWGGFSSGPLACWEIAAPNSLVYGIESRQCDTSFELTASGARIAQSRFTCRTGRVGNGLQPRVANTVIGPHNDISACNIGIALWGPGILATGNDVHDNNQGIEVDGNSNDVRRNAIAGSAFEGIRVVNGVTGTLIRHNVVDGNGADAILVPNSASGTEVRNNLLTNNGGNGMTGNAGAYASRNPNGFFGNVDPPFAFGDPDATSVLADPLYVNRVLRDFRILRASPMINRGVDLGLDVNGPGPGFFFGSSPDLGMVETPF